MLVTSMLIWQLRYISSGHLWLQSTLLYVVQVHVQCIQLQFVICDIIVSYPLLPLPPDLNLTPDTLLHAVSTVTHFWGEGRLLYWLDVPPSVQDQIRASPSYSSEDERRMAGLQYYLQTVSGASWGRIASVLWYMEEHTALESVRQYLPHQHGECVYNLVAIAYFLANIC